MNYSMIFDLIWKIVYSILKKEGVFGEGMLGDPYQGTTSPTTEPTTVAAPKDATNFSEGLMSILGNIVSNIQ